MQRKGSAWKLVLIGIFLTLIDFKPAGTIDFSPLPSALTIKICICKVGLITLRAHTHTHCLRRCSGNWG